MTSTLPTGAISHADAKNLLVRTSERTRSGRIHSPYSSSGYALQAALDILDRCDPAKTYLKHEKGRPILLAYLPGHGEHAWDILMVSERGVTPWT